MLTAENPLSYLTKQHVFKEATFLEAGEKLLVLKRGTWSVVMNGGAGGGGGKGSGYNGGAGGQGLFTLQKFDLDTTSRVQIYVGEGGKTRTNGGNGGAGHSNFHVAGHGGGAGKPTYLTYYDEQQLYHWGSVGIYTRTNEVKTTSPVYGKNGEVNTNWTIENIEDIENSDYKNVTFKYITGDTLIISSENAERNQIANLPLYIYANGGGGGGGGGASGASGRYNGGAGGAGGGGYFRFDYDNLSIITSVPGKDGGTGGSNYSSSRRNAGAGVQGNITDFPTLKSGSGTSGSGQGGGSGSTGGGASGGGGGGGHNSGSAYSGSGGGGAGGDLDAGGGAGGEYATNYHLNPTSIEIRNLKYGIPANLGQGGAGSSTTNTEGEEGNNGWIYLLRYEDIDSIIDCQFIVGPAQSSDNYGNITDEVTETTDYNDLTGSESFGNIIEFSTVDTIIDLGLLGQEITQQQDMGHI